MTGSDPRRDDLLQHLDPSRREFVKGLIAATSFATPLIASFSLDGLTIESAEAIHFGNQANQCFQITEYVGPREFLATLWSADQTGHHGVARFKASSQGTSLEYRLKFSSGLNMATIQLVMYDDFDEPFPDEVNSVLATLLVALIGKKGNLKDVDVAPCTMAFLLQEMAAGFVWVRAETSGGEIIQGRIVPQEGDLVD